MSLVRAVLRCLSKPEWQGRVPYHCYQAVFRKSVFIYCWITKITGNASIARASTCVNDPILIFSSDEQYLRVVHLVYLI